MQIHTLATSDRSARLHAHAQSQGPVARVHSQLNCERASLRGLFSTTSRICVLLSVTLRFNTALRTGGCEVPREEVSPGHRLQGTAHCTARRHEAGASERQREEVLHWPRRQRRKRAGTSLAAPAALTPGSHNRTIPLETTCCTYSSACLRHVTLTAAPCLHVTLTSAPCLRHATLTAAPCLRHVTLAAAPCLRHAALTSVPCFRAAWEASDLTLSL